MTQSSIVKYTLEQCEHSARWINWMAVPALSYMKDDILSALSCLVPYVKWLSKILSGRYEICRVAYIQFIFSAQHVLRVRVELSQPSYTIGAQSWPFLQNYYLIADYSVLPFGGYRDQPSVANVHHTKSLRNVFSTAHIDENLIHVMIYTGTLQQ